MRLGPWRKREIGNVVENDDLWGALRSAFGVPITAFENRLPEVFRTPTFPSLNVSETDTAFTVTAELPGLEEKDIDVRIIGDQLVISGERKWEEEKEGERYHRIESQYGSFERSITLPTDLVAEPDAVQAKYDKGMLRIEIPKVEPTRPRRIEVKTP